MKITTYKDWSSWIKAFSERHITLLICLGRGGIGKTYNVEEGLKNDEPIIFKGHATPLSIYVICLKNPNSLIVFDDVDELLNNKKNVALLKQLCDTKEEKSVYYSTTSKLDGKEIPKSFRSRNKIILLMNNPVNESNKDMLAVLTRGFNLSFEPSNEEVLRVMKLWAKDKTIIKELEDNLYKIKNLNFRLYTKCEQLKNSGLCYKTYLRESYNLITDDDVLREVIKLEPNERNQVWKNKTGLSVRTLQRKIKELKK